MNMKFIATVLAITFIGPLIVPLNWLCVIGLATVGCSPLILLNYIDRKLEKEISPELQSKYADL